MSSNTISLKTSDGAIFEASPTLTKNMKTVQTIIGEADADVSIIPLLNVSSSHINKIIEYQTLSDDGKEKEFSVEELNNDEVKEFLLAVHYLNMESLFELLTGVVADRIKNKNVGYVREYFGVENDFTPKEEAEVRQRNSWTFKGDEVESDEWKRIVGFNVYLRN